MQFGLVLNCQHPIGDDMMRRLDEHLEQARAAREAGFDLVACIEHFLMPPYQMLAQAPFLARVAAEVEGMKIATAISLAALHNPVDLADVAATLDVISGGRLIFGVGLGYREVEFDAFGVPKAKAARIFEERLQIIKRLWTEDNITYQGHGFKLVNATAPLKPVQKPHPPIWIAANSHKAVQRAARLGHAWYINPHARLDTLREQWALYRKTLAEYGHPLPEHRPLRRELYIAASRKEALEIARPYIEQKYRVYVQHGQDKALPKGDALDLPFDELLRDRFVIGGPDEVIEELETYVRELEANFFVFRVQWHGMDQEATLRAIRLVGRHIIPYFKGKYGAS
ncbi:MAG TPA: LLM class flavin-dependent oxidoreductase [Bacillota bacterium]